MNHWVDHFLQHNLWDDLLRILEQEDLKFLVRRNGLNRTLGHLLAAKESLPVTVFQKWVDRVVKETLDENRILRQVDFGGNTLLHMAAFSGHPETVATALRSGVPQTKNDRGLTPCFLGWIKYIKPSFTVFERKTFQSDETCRICSRQKERLALLWNTAKEGIQSTLPADPLVRLWWRTLHLLRSEDDPTADQVEMPLLLQQGGPSRRELAFLVLQRGGNEWTECPALAFWWTVTSFLCCQDGDNDDKDEKEEMLQKLLLQAAEGPELALLPLNPAIKTYMREIGNAGWAEYADRSVLAQLCYVWTKTTTGRSPPSLPNKRLLLHSAIASGKPWKDGINVLLAIDPTSILVRDPVTNLPPLGLAAVNTSLTTVYHMLRYKPMLVNALLRDKETSNRVTAEAVLRSEKRPRYC